MHGFMALGLRPTEKTADTIAYHGQILARRARTTKDHYEQPRCLGVRTESHHPREQLTIDLGPVIICRPIDTMSLKWDLLRLA
jgi:hypothetical protein